MKYIYYTLVLTESERNLINELVTLAFADRDSEADDGRADDCLSVMQKLSDEEDAWLTPARPAKVR